MLSKKLILNPVPGLSFNGEGGKHIHLINGIEVPGCTTVSSLFQDDGWKFAWPVKLMAEKLMPFIKDGILIEEDDLLKAKNAWREKRDKSADSGTIAHAWIEEYLKTGRDSSFLEDKEAIHCIQNFQEWENKLNPEWLASEVQVGSLKHSFAGILDALAYINGKLTLVDFKTSSAIKADYSIQLAGLMICLEEMGCIPEQRAILHLPKEGKIKWDYRVLNGNLEEEKKDFVVALNFYRRKNLFAARSK